MKPMPEEDKQTTAMRTCREVLERDTQRHRVLVHKVGHLHSLGVIPTNFLTSDMNLDILLFVTLLVAVHSTNVVREYNLDDFLKLIEVYGVKAIDFLRCMGLEFEANCGPQTMKCFEGKEATKPLDCIRRLECAGAKGEDCVDMLRNTTGTSKTSTTTTTRKAWTLPPSSTTKHREATTTTTKALTLPPTSNATHPKSMTTTTTAPTKAWTHQPASTTSCPVHEATTKTSDYATTTHSEFNKFTKLIVRYGPKALLFLECMGEEFEEHCGTVTMECFEGDNNKDPLTCIRRLECGGKKGSDCADKLEDTTETSKTTTTTATTKAFTLPPTSSTTHLETTSSPEHETTTRTSHKVTTDTQDFNKFTKLIVRYGPKALLFLECMGEEFEEHCGTVTMECFEGDNNKDPLTCIRRLECGGKKGSDCADRLEDTTTRHVNNPTTVTPRTITQPTMTSDHATTTHSEFVQFTKLIVRYGPKALLFLECMGEEFEEHCGTVTMKCFEGDNDKDPLACIRRLICGGKKGSDCVNQLGGYKT